MFRSYHGPITEKSQKTGRQRTEIFVSYMGLMANPAIKIRKSVLQHASLFLNVRLTAFLTESYIYDKNNEKKKKKVFFY